MLGLDSVESKGESGRELVLVDRKAGGNFSYRNGEWVVARLARFLFFSLFFFF